LRYLTKKGVSFLESNTDLAFNDIRFPKRPEKRLKNDYFHRVSTVFINISFDKRLEKTGATDRKFLVYYDNKKESTSRNFDAETRMNLGGKKHFTPDVICGFTDAQGKPKVFCLEVYNGKKIGYVEKQLISLFKILESSKKIEQRIGVDAIPRILVTFDNDSLFQKVLERIKKNPFFRVEGIEQLLFFKLDTNVRKDFGVGWVNIGLRSFDLEELGAFGIS